MAKKNVSLGGLIDLGKVEKILKKGDRIFWTKDDEYDVICNGHWVIKAIITKESKINGTLFTLFEGNIPTDDVVLTRAKMQRAEECKTDIKSFLRNKGYELPVSYTRMMVEVHERTAKLFICPSTKTLIGVNKDYTDLLLEYSSVVSEDGTAIKPLFFKGGFDEEVMLLPMRITIPKWIDEKAD